MAAQRRRMYNFNNAEDVDEIRRALLDEDEDNLPTTDILSSDDEVEEEVIEERDGDSETEQSDDEEMLTREPGEEDENFYIAYKKNKNKIIDFWRWKKTPLRLKRGKQNTLCDEIGVVMGNARSATTPLEAWGEFFNNSMLELIVKYTNQYIELNKRPKYQRDRDTRFTDVTEIKALFGLLYLAGRLRAHRLNTLDLWDNNGHGVEIFGLVMSRMRFHFLLNCLHFDDRITRNERLNSDRLCHVREMFQQFIENCQKSYSPGVDVTLDEKLEGFRGRCQFLVYIPSKPRKYGIKIYAAVDSEVYYVYNLEIYAGKQPEGSSFEVSNSPAEVVRRMCAPLYNSGRNITMDNWFSDVSLAEEMTEKKLSIVGTLKKNKAQIPMSFKNVTGRETNSSIFGFRTKTTMVSYVPKPKKNVVLISTMHNDNAIDATTGDKQKPEIITYYNKHKSGVDKNDEMCETYAVNRNTRRWPMVILYSMLNMAGINAQVILGGNGIKSVRRRLFLKRLGEELVKDHLNRRTANSRGIPLPLQTKIKSLSSRIGNDMSQENSETNISDETSATADTSLTNFNSGHQQRGNRIQTLGCDTVRENQPEHEVHHEDTSEGFPIIERNMRSRYTIDASVSNPEFSRKRKKCVPCKITKKEKSTRFSCVSCDKYLCLDHCIMICDMCAKRH